MRVRTCKHVGINDQCSKYMNFRLRLLKTKTKRAVTW